MALVLCVNNMQLLQCDVHLQLESYPVCWLTQTSGVTASFVLLTGETEEASWIKGAMSSDGWVNYFDFALSYPE